jgi:hypothetical protein
MKVIPKLLKTMKPLKISRIVLGIFVFRVILYVCIFYIYTHMNNQNLMNNI